MVKLFSNKAQVKIQQTAFMLIALTVLFVLIFLFYISFKSASINKSAETLAEQEAILIASRLAESPEFSCGQAYGSSKTYCIDLDKAYTLSKNSEEYKDFWDLENIEIRKIYPEDKELCKDSNYPDCGYIKIFDPSDSNLGADHSTFVTLCRKSFEEGVFYDKCELGKLIVRYKLNA